MRSSGADVDRPAHPLFLWLLGCRIEAAEIGRVAQIQSLNHAI